MSAVSRGGVSWMMLKGRLGFWAALPFLVPQGMRVRKIALRFKPADGPASGQVGSGQSLRLLAIGDSIIAGAGIPTLAEALVGQLAKALVQRTGRRVHWTAHGRNGIRSAAVRRRLLPEARPQKVDCVFLSVGVNDVTALRRTESWRQDIRDLFQELRLRQPAAEIVVMGLPPLHGFPLLPVPLRFVLGWRARWFDCVLRDEALQHARVHHVPIDFIPHPEHFAPDGFHPGIEACRVLGKTLADIVGLSLTAAQAGSPDDSF